MKIKSVLIASSLLLSSNLYATDATINMENKLFRIQGESSAVAACKSVIKDNVTSLRRTLRYSRSSIRPFVSYKDFTCNKADLFSFANDIGSMKVSGYLQNKFNIEDINNTIDIQQVSSINH